MRIVLVGLNARYVHSCLALYYLRNELRRHLPDCRPKIIQFTINDPYYSTLLQISSERPQSIFFSVYIWNSEYVRRLVVDLSAIRPDAKIILGGPQAPHVFDRCSCENFSRPANFTVVKGEVETIPSFFYNHLISGPLKSEYTASPAQSFTFPYLQQDFNDSLKNRYIYYESSRGCPFSCTYCLSSVHGNVCHKDILKVQDELRMILAHRPKVVRFIDRTFNDLPKRALDIWKFLAAQKVETLFHFEVSPDRFTDEMLTFLKQLEPGRFQFEIGIQSTSELTLATIKRRVDLNKMKKNITRLADLDNIHLHVDLILGLPYENQEIFAKSFNDVIELQPHYIQMGLLKVLPDTAISRSVEDFGMTVCKNPPYEILATQWLDQTALSELYWFGETVEAFYNNRFFRCLWRYILKSSETGYHFFKSLYLFCKQRDFFSQSPTPDLMSRMLAEFSANYPDADLRRELMVYDWLRCGFRYLPEHLQNPHFDEAKNRLWNLLPPSWEGVYDHQKRSRFFKQSMFCFFSGKALVEIGMTDMEQGGYVCFLSESSPGVFKYNKTMLLPVEVMEKKI